MKDEQPVLLMEQELYSHWVKTTKGKDIKNIARGTIGAIVTILASCHPEVRKVIYDTVTEERTKLGDIEFANLAEVAKALGFELK
jgi:hypothetical protein